VRVIIGVDEVGTGALAGPVVVAAVAFPIKSSLPGLDDSKKLSNSKRHHLRPMIERAALHWAIARSTSKKIDEFGIAVCKRACMREVATRCLQALSDDVDVEVIVDGVDPIPGVVCRCIIKADATVPAVSAASILAKVHRDDYMRKIAEKYPRYFFDRHVGYGTSRHLRALEREGPCPEHRRSFAPVRKIVK
jgi:ribonuclease HII